MDNTSSVFPILGTMTIGSEGQVKAPEAQVMLRTFAGASSAKTPAGTVMMDTARIYQNATPDGDTETILGQLLEQSPSLGKKAHLATKANPGMAPHFSLSKQSVIEQCNKSLEKLGVDCVDLFYLHSPDVKTNINDTLDGIEELHKSSKFIEFGLSNYPAWAVVDIWYRCKSRGMVLPTVYQGAYNVITRSMEPEIVPVAREFGLRLYMYNPLAGGLLSGRYTTMEDVEASTEGRFSPEFDRAFGGQVKAGAMYRSRYSKKPYFDALTILREAIASQSPASAQESTEPAKVEETVTEVDGVRVKVQIVESTRKTETDELTMVGVALRWLIHHSYLAGGDGVILGVSKSQHLVANLAAWRAGPLPSSLLEACDAAWEAARPVCDSYFRGYGAKPGGIELFVKLKADQEKAKL